MKTLIILSGGLDSTTLLYRALQDGHHCSAVTFDYGQKHVKEIQCAVAICKALSVTHYLVKIDLGVTMGSALLDSDSPVPHGHYEDESMKDTVVPGRNLLFATRALMLAVQHGCNQIAIGVHAGDHAIYPDCRPRFVELLGDILEAYECGVSLWTPYLHESKISIAKDALRLGVPIDRTWTCYEGGSRPCGKCGSCVERDEAVWESGGGQSVS